MCAYVYIGMHKHMNMKIVLYSSCEEEGERLLSGVPFRLRKHFVAHRTMMVGVHPFYLYEDGK